MDDSQFQSLVRELISLSRETEWVEFKHNQAAPEDIGEYLAALSKSAGLIRLHSGTWRDACYVPFWALELCHPRAGRSLSNEK